MPNHEVGRGRPTDAARLWVGGLPGRIAAKDGRRRVAAQTGTGGGRLQFVGGSIALDFVNTVGNRLNRLKRRDHIQSIDDLVRWAGLAGIALPASSVRRPSARASRDLLSRARGLRESLHRLFASVVDAKRPRPTDVAALTGEIRRARAFERLVHVGARFEWQPEAGVPSLDRLFAEVALDAADLLVSSRNHDLRRCRDADCGWLFLDRSQGHRRTWCSMADCGNRSKARRHYALTRREPSPARPRRASRPGTGLSARG